MNVNNIARTILAVQIMLHSLTGSFIMARHTFSQLGDERVKCYLFRVSIDSVDESRRCDDVNFHVQHFQCIYGEIAISTSKAYILSKELFVAELIYLMI